MKYILKFVALTLLIIGCENEREGKNKVDQESYHRLVGELYKYKDSLNRLLITEERQANALSKGP